MPARDAVLTQLPLLTALSLALFLPTSIALVWGVQRVDPGRVGILLMIELVVGAASAAVWTAEPFGLREAVGALMIVGAGLVEVLGRQRERPAATGLTATEKMAPGVGFEPTTSRLTAGCSTAELPRNGFAAPTFWTTAHSERGL